MVAILPPAQLSTTPPNDDLLTLCLNAARTSVLSVGSGDGSQQLSIVEQGHVNLCVTFFDSKEKVLKKYPHAASILRELERKCRYPPAYGVDATRLELYKKTLGTFDLVFFTFPHTGVPNGKPESIRSNQDLLRGFLRSVRHLLKPNGQVQLTLKTGEFYEQWKLQSIVKEVTGLTYEGCGLLKPKMFPGYKHRLTNGMQGNLKVVPDKGGAKIHRFRHNYSSPSSSSQFETTTGGGITWIDIVAMNGSVNSPKESKNNAQEGETVSATVNHGELSENVVERRIVSYFAHGDLSTKRKLPTVLDIRREAFEDPLPAVSQLNRVLYRLKEREQLMQHPCQGSSKKPRWSLP